MELKPFDGTLDDASAELKPFSGQLDPPTQVAPATPAIARPSSTIRRVVGDTAVDLGKGLLGVGEAVVGAGNIVSGGYVGKGLEAIGYDPVTSKKMLEEGYTPERVAANKEVADAKGFMPTIAAAIKNPSTIAGAVVESAPLMLGGGAVSQGLKRVIASPIVRGAIGEGLVGAGASAEQTRQQSDTGLLDAKGTVSAIGAGAGTAVLGALGGKAAQKLGIADVDTALAGGSTLAGPKKNILRRAAQGVLAEGVFEELPQSAQEQMWSNYATGKPIMDGVAEASAMGAVTGGVMGGGFSAIARPPVPQTAGENPDNGTSEIARPQLALPAPDGTKSYGTIEVGPDGTARKTMPDGVLAVNDAPVAQPTVPGNRAAASSLNQQATAGDPFAPAPEEMAAEMDAAMGAQSGLDRAQSGQEPAPPSVAGMPEPVVNRVQEAADNLRMLAQVRDAQAETGLGKVAAMATAMQADAIEQEAPLDRLARVATAAGFDPAEVLKANLAYDPDGETFADLPDEVLSGYAKTLLEDAARERPAPEQRDVDSVGLRGNDVPAARDGEASLGSLPVEANGGAASLAGQAPVQGDAAGAQAEGVTRNKPLPNEREGDAPVGAWVAGPKIPGVAPADAVRQVMEVPIDQIDATEFDSAGNIAPEKRADASRYAEAMRNGDQFPNARGSVLPNGKIKLQDGHRRLAAAIENGATTLRVAVNPMPATAGQAKDSSQGSGKPEVQASALAESSPAGSSTYSDDRGGFAGQQATQPPTETTADRAGQTAQTAAPLSPQASQSNASVPSPQGTPVEGGGQPSGAVDPDSPQGRAAARDAGVPASLIAARDAATVRSQAASAAMQAFPAGPMGLTPDAVKATPEWKAARIEMDRAATALRTANSEVTKAIKTVKAKPAPTVKPRSQMTSKELKAQEAGKVKAKRSSLKTGPARKPRDLLDVIARSGGLNREAMRAQGLDPAGFNLQSGIRYVFRKKGGMSMDGLLEFMQQEGYLPRDIEGAPPTIGFDDVMDVLDRALRGGQAVYADDQGEAVAEYLDAKRQADEEYQAEMQASPAFGGQFDAMMEQADNAAYVKSYAELTEEAYDLGATSEDIIEASFRDDPSAYLQNVITRLSNENNVQSVAEESNRSGRAEPRAEAQPRPEGFSLASQAVAQEPAREVSSPGLFAPPTAREQVAAATKDREASRNGLGRDLVRPEQGDGELLAGPKPTQSTVPAPPVEAAQQDVMESVEEARDLITTHNTTAKKIAHADRVGGFAVPSLAVTRGTESITGFGDITLIGDPRLADPKQGAKAFGSDIYSPRYPTLSYRLDSRSLSALNKELAPFADGREIYGAEITSARDLTENKAFRAYAKDKVRHLADGGDMDALAAKVLQKAGAEERIFQGFTNSGNRRYTPHTLENVVKILKKDLRGGEGGNYGTGSLRARFTPQFSSVAAIRKAKGRLQKKEVFEAAKQEIETELFGIAADLAPYYKYDTKTFGFNDTVLNVIGDSVKGGLERQFREYGFEDVPAETQQRIRAYMGALREMPTEYFEVIQPRAVGLSEFRAAVIPSDTDADTRGILERAGIELVEYQQGDNDARRAAVQQVSTDQNLLFQQESETLADTDLTPAERASFNRQREYGFRGSDGAGLTDNERSALQVLEREESRANGIEDADKLGLRSAINAVIGGHFGMPPITAVYLRGVAGLDGIVKEGYIQRLQDQKAKRGAASKTAGLFLSEKDTVDGRPRFVIFTDVIRTPQMAAFTAAHEVAGHYGLRNLLGPRLNKTLDLAGQNATVKAIADSMVKQRNLNPNQRHLAIEEALADLAAAVRTKNFQRIKDKHGVEVPKVMQSRVRSMLDTIVQRIKELFRRKDVRFSDGQVRELLENAWSAAQRPESAIGQPQSALESTEDQTQSEAFKKWFGSSVVTEDGKAGGKALVVYHGTGSEFDVFGRGRGAIYFASDAEVARAYADDKTSGDGEDAAPRVVEAYLRITNPKVVTQAWLNENAADDDGAVDWTALDNIAYRAEEDGHDGLILRNVRDYSGFVDGKRTESEYDQYVVFRPEQIKSTANNGNFNPDNPSILESVEGDMFAVDTPETITAADLKIPGQIAVKREGVKGWLNAAGKKLTDLKPAALALVPLNHLADFAAKGMTAVQQYVDQHYAMQAYRNGLYRDYDAIAQDWLKFASGRGLKGLLGKVVSKQGKDLSDLMHDSTIAGVDPTQDESDYRKDPGKAEAYRKLRARYEALPAQGQDLFNRVRDSYKRQSAMLEEVIEGNLKRAMEINRAQAERTYEARVQEIEESGASADEKARLKANAANAHDDKVKDADQRVNAKMLALRKTFESMRVEAPYFPLKRYGKYWVTVLQNGTMKGFSKFETAEEQDAFVKEMESQGFQARKKYESPDNKTHEMIDPAFIAEIEGILDGAQMPDSVKDDIWQAYLERMPDMSLRKSFIHRQKVQGYHPDALRAFSSTAFHGSYQLARLKFGMEMAETLDIAEKQAARVAPVQGEQLVGELRKRHDFIMNPTGGALAQGVTTAAFIYYLGANPAHLLLNATQTIMLGVPMLGSRHGFGRTVKALQRAMTDFAQGKGHMENANLSDDEKRAFQSFLDSGLIDKTQAHDLAGVGETGVEYNAVRQKVMNKIGWFFHQSERFNREVTAMAAYRLARNEGRGHDLAVAQAMRSTYDIHFDYSAAARARVMQGDTAKALLVFRNYNVNLLYRLFRDIHQSLRGESVQVRREARKQLGGMMGMYGLFAGVAGMPFYGLAMALAGAFEDDDDPETAEQQFVRGTVELLGPDVARVLLRGVPGATFNVDLSERIGMPNLWFRSPDRELEGRDAYYYWMEQLLGAGVGVVKQGYDGSSLIFDGLQEANTGHVARGFEKMLPAALKNVFKSVRYGADGVTTLDGEKILDLGVGGLVAQGLGYTPLDLAEQYDTNRDLKNANAKLERRRRALLDRFFLAVQHGDPTDRAMTDIQAFNARNPDYAITRQTMSRSNKLRQRNSLLNENGIVMTRRMRRLQDRLNNEETE